MAIEIRVPTLGESVTEATVGQWFKKPGEAIAIDEPLVELETDKVTVEVPAPAAGVLGEVSANENDTVEVGALLGILNEGEAAAAQTAGSQKSKSAPASEPVPTSGAGSATAKAANDAGANGAGGGMPPSPAARKAMAEAGLTTAEVQGSGKRGQILKHDVTAAKAASAGVGASGNSAPKATGMQRSDPAPAPIVRANVPAPPVQMRLPSAAVDAEREERVKMTRLRQTIARRLKDAQNTAAMLTTFNDVDMTAVMEMRKQYKDLFEKRHGVKLGFMGFFVKACLQALKEIPAVNAEIDGGDLVYKNYYHIGVAVGTDRGLVVPVLRDADLLGLAEIEGRITEFGQRAREGKLSIDEMQGGTFTITNGGVFGSMLSTPILNVPQSGILGMHRIEERPVVIDGQVVARPMMYLALTYDHRIVDGKEAVTFLVRIKECLEDPHRFVLNL